MSEDLIRRSDAVKKIKWWFDLIELNPDILIDSIITLPTIEPKHGEWIRTGRTNIYGGIEVQCSNCGDRVMVQHLEDEWYCRHCGADMGMKGADDE